MQIVICFYGPLQELEFDSEDAKLEWPCGADEIYSETRKEDIQT